MKAQCYLWALMGLMVLLSPSCKKESFYSLKPSDQLAGFLPRNTTVKRYVSNNGDTISFLQNSIDTVSERINENVGTTGSIGDLDYVEAVEYRVNLTGLFSPFEINYQLGSTYDGTLQSRSKDELIVSYHEDKNEKARLQINYTDSLFCESRRCNFISNLKLQTKSFSNVYFLERDSVNRCSIYINKAKGLLGFRTSDNRIFELID